MKLKTLLSASRFLQDGTRDFSYNYGYTYDPVGNPSQRTSQGQIRNYTANNLNQLNSATAPTATDVTGKVEPSLVAPFNVTVNGQAATVDPQGNWIANVPLTQGENTITVEATDRFARETPSFVRRDGTTEGRRETREVTLMPAPVFAYDPNGNMTSDGTWTYVYNQENRMISATSASSVVKVEFTYNGQGKEVERKKTENGVVTAHVRYVWDGWNKIAKLDALNSDAVLKTYTWGLDISGSLTAAGGVGALLSVTDSTGTYYPCYDGNGNITAYVNSSTGEIAAHYEYGPFGEITFQSGPKANDFAYRFSTKELEPNTGLVLYQLRPYSTKLGRFTSRDPIEEKGFIFQQFKAEELTKIPIKIKDNKNKYSDNKTLANYYLFGKNDLINQFDVLGLRTYEKTEKHISGVSFDRESCCKAPEPCLECLSACGRLFFRWQAALMCLTSHPSCTECVAESAQCIKLKFKCYGYYYTDQPRECPFIYEMPDNQFGMKSCVYDIGYGFTRSIQVGTGQSCPRSWGFYRFEREEIPCQ